MHFIDYRSSFYGDFGFENFGDSFSFDSVIANGAEALPLRIQPNFKRESSGGTVGAVVALSTENAFQETALSHYFLTAAHVAYSFYRCYRSKEETKKIRSSEQIQMDREAKERKVEMIENQIDILMKTIFLRTIHLNIE